MNNNTIWVNEPLVVIIIFIFSIVIVIFIIIIVIIIPLEGVTTSNQGLQESVHLSNIKILQFSVMRCSAHALVSPLYQYSEATYSDL